MQKRRKELISKENIEESDMRRHFENERKSKFCGHNKQNHQRLTQKYVNIQIPNKTTA